MKRSLVLAAVTVAVLPTGCASSIDPAAKADLDARIANLRARSITIAAPPEGALGPMPLAAGQWVQYKMTLSNGQPKLLTQKILKQQGDAFWIELVHDTYQGKTVQQMLVAFGNDGKAELRTLRTKDPRGRIGMVSGRQLSWPLVTYDDYRGTAASLVARWPSGVEDTAVVPAGQFEGCSRHRSVFHMGWRNEDLITSTWRHPSVPLSGVVRWEDSLGFVSELVNYGTTGAQKEF